MSSQICRRAGLYLKPKFFMLVTSVLCMSHCDFCGHVLTDTHAQELATGLRGARTPALPGTRQMSHPQHLVTGAVSLQEGTPVPTATDRSFREKQGQKRWDNDGWLWEPLCFETILSAQTRNHASTADAVHSEMNRGQTMSPWASLNIIFLTASEQGLAAQLQRSYPGCLCSPCYAISHRPISEAEI